MGSAYFVPVVWEVNLSFSTALNPLAYMYLCMWKNYNFVHSFEPERIKKHHLSLCWLFFLSPFYSYINILVVTITLMSIKKYSGVSPKKGLKGEYLPFFLPICGAANKDDAFMFKWVLLVFRYGTPGSITKEYEEFSEYYCKHFAGK